MDEKEDLPKSIVVILVVLAVVISILGTFTVLTEINRLNNAPVQQGTSSQNAKISLQVIDPNAPSGIKTTGKIIFQVLKEE